MHSSIVGAPRVLNVVVVFGHGIVMLSPGHHMSGGHAMHVSGGSSVARAFPVVLSVDAFPMHGVGDVEFLGQYASVGQMVHASPPLAANHPALQKQSVRMSDCCRERWCAGSGHW
eukprot:354199-Rhodomonas_salina.1